MLTWLVAFLIACPSAAAEEPLVLPLWPGVIPGEHGTIGPERVRAPSEAPTQNAKWITGVSRPAITIFRPTKTKNSGTAIIICPGGGCWNLAGDLEGEEVAAWLNTAGVTAVLLYFIEQEPAGVEINKDTLAPYMRIPKETPPILLVHASDDSVAGAESS